VLRKRTEQWLLPLQTAHCGQVTQVSGQILKFYQLIGSRFTRMYWNVGVNMMSLFKVSCST